MSKIVLGRTGRLDGGDMLMYKLSLLYKLGYIGEAIDGGGLGGGR